MWLAAGCAGGSSTGTPPSGNPKSSASPQAATCSDSDDPRLRSVTLTSTGDVLSVRWETQNLGSPETTLWAVIVTGDGGGVYQLGVKQIGAKAQSWVFDFGTAKQADVSAPGLVSVAASGVSESFPYSDMPDLGGSFEWKAILNLDGKDVAACPGAGGSLSMNR